MIKKEFQDDVKDIKKVLFMREVIDGFQYGLCVVSSERAGAKHYELTNHLGNVLAVISDHKIAVDATSDNLADYYLPDVLSMSDYYPFGSAMPVAYQSCHD